MNLKEALEIREKNKKLLGKVNDKGMRIVDVFVAPLESKSFTQFLSRYAQTKDNLLSLMPFANQAMTVKARVESVDDPSINVFFMHSELSEILNNNN